MDRRDGFGTSIHLSSPSSTVQRPTLPRTMSDSTLLSPEETSKISACDLLNRDPSYNGFLYKRAKEKVTDRIPITQLGNLKWQLRYVVLYQHQIIYYKNERSNSPQGSFSLRGYNRVLRSVEMESADQQWAFKLIGLRADDRTWYFAAASEREMKLWMAHFKVAMEECLHGQAKDRSMKILTDLKAKNTAESKQGLHLDEESRQSMISNESSGSSFEPGVYEDIESEVYDESDRFEEEQDSRVQDIHRGYLDGGYPRERPLPQRPDGLGSSPKTSQWEGVSNVHRGSLQRPMLPQRSPMPRRAQSGLGHRHNSDPTRPAFARQQTTPRLHQRHCSVPSTPSSPGCRPKFPEPVLPSETSITSEDSDDYIKPNDPEEESVIKQNYNFGRSVGNGFKKEEDLGSGRPIRREPDGTSFRGNKPFEEKQHPQMPEIPTYDTADYDDDDSDGDSHDYEPPPEKVPPNKKLPPPPPSKFNKPMLIQDGRPDVLGKPKPTPRPPPQNTKPNAPTQKPVISNKPGTFPRPVPVTAKPVLPTKSNTLDSSSGALRPNFSSSGALRPPNVGSSGALRPPSIPAQQAKFKLVRDPREVPHIDAPSLPGKSKTSTEQPVDVDDESPYYKPSLTSPPMGKPPPTKPKPGFNKVGKLTPSSLRKQQSFERHQDVEELLPSTAVISSCDKIFCEGLLKQHQQEGMYLLRMASDKQGKVLMVWYGQEQKSKHYKVFGDNISSFALDQNPRFTTMTELIIFYQQNYLPHSMLTLTTPYRG
ncbi:uncharacterized protein [Amphiura filiformis]|uniref:uncharacterized protein isoform X5 n=1 Tax=Amphiura filiformis TaxID=82378 RepID=UPI003B221486